MRARRAQKNRRVLPREGLTMRSGLRILRGGKVWMLDHSFLCNDYELCISLLAGAVLAPATFFSQEAS